MNLRLLCLLVATSRLVYQQAEAPQKTKPAPVQLPWGAPLSQDGPLLNFAFAFHADERDEANEALDEMLPITSDRIKGKLPKGLMIKPGAGDLKTIVYFGKTSDQQLQFQKDFLKVAKSLLKTGRIVNLSELGGSIKPMMGDLFTNYTGFLPDEDSGFHMQLSLTRFFKVGGGPIPLEKDLTDPFDSKLAEGRPFRRSNLRASERVYVQNRAKRGPMVLRLRGLPDIQQFTNLGGLDQGKRALWEATEFYVDQYAERYREVYEGWDAIVQEAVKAKGLDKSEQWIYDIVEQNRSGQKPMYGNGSISISPERRIEFTLALFYVENGQRRTALIGMSIPPIPIPSKRK